MKFYEEYCLPHVINCACGLKDIEKQRAKVVPLARGVVLEVGMGSGLNLKHYNCDEVEMIWGLEPSLGMRRKAQSNLVQSKVPVKWLSLPGEDLPLENASVDTVVLTYTLCTIADWQAALCEMRRVLRPQGQLIFCEHGESPDKNVRNWQGRLNPLWKKLAGGCNLNRPIPQLIESVDFTIISKEEGYLKGPKIATYQYWGTAE